MATKRSEVSHSSYHQGCVPMLAISWNRSLARRPGGGQFSQPSNPIQVRVPTILTLLALSQTLLVRLMSLVGRLLAVVCRRLDAAVTDAVA